MHRNQETEPLPKRRPAPPTDPPTVEPLPAEALEAARLRAWSLVEEARRVRAAAQAAVSASRLARARAHRVLYEEYARQISSAADRPPSPAWLRRWLSVE